jgi:Zn-dependent peptidase ImmA (M78 family)/DNA-binding XRE family transcriptional regulator
VSENILETVSARIKQARLICGYSQRALAEKTNGKLSHNAIAKYERGEMTPGSKALVTLATALKQPLDFFVRDFEPPIQRVRHLKKTSKVSPKAAQALTEKAQSFFERYWEIEKILSARTDYEPPIESGELRTPERIGELADQLRDVWKLGRDPLPNIHQLMESKGIKVHELETDNKAVDGFSAWSAQGDPLVVIASWLNADVPRKRMTEAHELAHIVLNIPDDIPEKDEEKIVWAFAGELMMPQAEFTDLFGQRSRVSLVELEDLKRHFGVSMMAIVYRAGKLGLLPPQAVKSFFMYANREGWRQNGEPGKRAYRGSESGSRFRKLVNRAVIEEKISEAKGAALLQISVTEFRKTLGGVTFDG